jgi:hypothetical protein
MLQTFQRFKYHISQHGDSFQHARIVIEVSMIYRCKAGIEMRHV